VHSVGTEYVSWEVVFLRDFMKKQKYYYQFHVLYIYIYTQGVSRLVDITAGGDFLGLCDQKSSYKNLSDFGRLRSYGHFLIPVHALV
jgi:hypothetical protein